MKDAPCLGDKMGRILAAAHQVFSSKGYHETRIDEIADLAGIGKGTIYLYFPGKQELFVAMLEDQVDRITGVLREKAAQPGGFPQRLAGVLTELLTMASDPARGWAENPQPPQTCEPQCRKLFVRARQDLLGILAHLLEEARSRGEIAEVDPSFGAAAILGMAQGFIIERFLTRRDIMDAEALAGAVVRLFLTGAAPRSGGCALN